MSKVKVDGYVQIPERAWYHIIDFITRIDDQLEVMIKQLDYTNKQLEKVVNLLSAVARVPVVVTPTPAPAPTPVPVPSKVIALPFRAKPIGTAKYTVTDGNATELALWGDAFIMGADSDVYIGERRDVQDFLMVAGNYLTVYRPAELNKLYVRSVSGTATVYMMYMQIVE